MINTPANTAEAGAGGTAEATTAQSTPAAAAVEPDDGGQAKRTADIGQAGEAVDARPGRTLREGLAVGLAERYGLLLIFAAVVLFFALWNQTSETYLTAVNVRTIVGNQAVVAMVVLAMVVPLTAGVLDLSAASICGVTSMAAAAAMSRFDAPVWVAVAVALAIGLGIGLINGIAVACFEINPIIETLGMATLLGGVMIWYSDGQPITRNLSLAFQDFGSLNWFGVPRLVVVLVPAILGTWYLLDHTPYGRYLHAIGSNPRSAKLVGIRVPRTLLTSLVIAGGLAALAGVLLCARAGGADPQTGPSFLFPAFAAVFLGATVIRPGKPNPLGAVIGVFFIAFTVSGFGIAGASAWASPVFNGAALLVAITLQTSLTRRRRT
ncbi:ABC transporter permease [Parafrankia sp. EUN1f]|uniref:ABC transporter permease n=1 Tax=Parafrankia sp. EUN1f TaxID=102897 RepID=UPI0001C45FA5|nr:ABC transporter permease [Parafrankia sp. EUN1f]EFC81429.1 inner-membrane translocator [Parafrankia sp. EUN1f]